MITVTTLDRLSPALTDRYRVEREIGRGGMATVYLARDLKHGRDVAIKVLHPQLACTVGAERFLREVQIEARLQHINILPLHDSGEADGLVYYVMPFVKGETLRARLDREGRLALEDALRIVTEIGEALSYAHAHDVLHRDVKPENILLSDGHAVLADFGIARAITEAGGTRVTTIGHAVGTPAYMSPEQAAGEADLDGRSDIYSLACVLYEMLAGRPPYEGRTPKAIIAGHMLETPPSIRALRSSVPPDIERAIEKALAKAPVDRFKTVGELLAALEAPSVPVPPGAARVAEDGTRYAAAAAEAVVGPRSARERWARALGRLRTDRAVGLALTAAVALLAGRLLWDRTFGGGGELDMSRVVVFPLAVEPEGWTAVGEDIATLIGYELESTGRLSWIDGWYDVRLAGVRAPAAGSPRSRARAHRAGYFVVGGVTLDSGEASIRLELHDVREGAILARGSWRGALDESWKRRAVRDAVEPLIAVLIPAGEDGDPARPGAAWGTPQAVAQFLDGERAYRRSRFTEALGHYKAAIAADSQLAIAAIKGARAAFWIRDREEAGALIGVALRHSGSLPPLQLQFVHGLDEYHRGRADSAVSRFRQAFDVAPEWWIRARLGEVYTHMLPRESPLDSLAEAEFAEVHRHDPELTPVLLHLIEFAARDGRIERADSLLASYRAVRPDSVLLARAELIVGCVRDGPASVAWRQAVLTRAAAVYEAARELARAGRQPECAAAAYRALLAYERSGGEAGAGHQFGAALDLQGLLVAQGKSEEARRLIQATRAASAATVGAALGDVSMLNTIAGADMGAVASSRVGEARRAFRSGEEWYGGEKPYAPYLWLLGVWEAYEGSPEAARAVADSLAASAARNDRRLDRLLSASLAAHAALAEGDSARALDLFRVLDATLPAGREWRTWDALGLERLQLARLLFARGEYREAVGAAASLDAPARPVMDLIYLPASLQLRLRAARALGDGALEARIERRLAALGREDLIRSARPEQPRGS